MMIGRSGNLLFGPALLGFGLFSSGFLISQEATTKLQPEYSAGTPQLEIYINEALERNPGIRQSFARYQAALLQKEKARSSFNYWPKSLNSDEPFLTIGKGLSLIGFENR